MDFRPSLGQEGLVHGLLGHDAFTLPLSSGESLLLVFAANALLRLDGGARERGQFFSRQLFSEQLVLIVALLLSFEFSLFGTTDGWEQDIFGV